MNMVIFWIDYLIVFSLAILAWSLIIFGFIGPPAVATPRKIILQALAEISLTKDAFLIDLGSGDGRVLAIAQKQYGAFGLGYEINPLLVLWSRLRALLLGVKNIKFKNKNYLKQDWSKADAIYMYLLPKYIPAVVKKIENEGKKGVMVVSQRFAIETWENKLMEEIPRKSNSTFIYKL